MVQALTTEDVSRIFKRHASALNKIRERHPEVVVSCIVDDRLDAPYLSLRLPENKKDQASDIPQKLGRKPNEINVHIEYGPRVVCS